MSDFACFDQLLLELKNNYNNIEEILGGLAHLVPGHNVDRCHTFFDGINGQHTLDESFLLLFSAPDQSFHTLLYRGEVGRMALQWFAIIGSQYYLVGVSFIAVLLTLFGLLSSSSLTVSGPILVNFFAN